ncbi:hypothetical protein [Sulfurovum sp.]|uniref:hypothetical protein n=1 Tax=Sulfurovum sp. TaxID=1969726 RepID=UPI002867C571|nr:hypothetical protein [Sulfurovum sp.]
MKFTTLSLVATLTISSSFAGGDIAPLETVAPAPVESMTTISGKLTGYYITNDGSDAYDMFSTDGSQLAFAATLDVTHKFTENVVANFSALGYVNTNRNTPYDYIYGSQYFESQPNGAIFNIANITATFADTTFILGRQFLDTPMVGGFDWLLSQGAFEAYTAVNSSFENLTLVGSYIRTWRPINAGDEWVTLTDINDGNNWTVGAAYDNKTLSGSIWYYNIDAGLEAGMPDKYAQVYIDGGYSFAGAKLEGQYVNTNYDFANDSNAYGAKISGDVSSFSLMAAYAYIDNNVVGYIERDGLYTSSWNTLGLSEGNTFKVEAGTEFAGISATASYAYYEYAQNMPEDEGHEVDVILGYNITDAIDLNVVYTNTDYGVGDGVNALEIYANYKF